MQVIGGKDKEGEERNNLRDSVQKETLRQLYQKSAEEKAMSMATENNLPYVDLHVIPTNPETVNAIPEEKAIKANMAIIYRVGKKWQIAVSDPEDIETKKMLEYLKTTEGITYNLVVVSEDGLKKAWEQYRFKTVTDNFENEGVSLKSGDLTDFEKGITGLIDLKKRIAEINTTEIFNIILAGAVKTRASDIHIEPDKETIRLRYRIDGVLQDIVKFPKSVHKTIISRIKMLAKMKLNITDIPQDGSFNVSLENNALNVRVSILPTTYGESVVMRVLSENAEGLDIDQIGLNEYYLDMILKEVSKPNGMILTTGPTGSGKTTSLYSFVRKVNDPGIKIITLENPVEYRIEGVTQTPVEQNEEFTFANGLRAVVRQDPDVIMVGEIRDDETAAIAVQAALTGHLVLSTLHTNNAAGAIPRLLHLGVNPALIAPAINAVIAQRLVRRLCEHCKEEYVPSEETMSSLRKILAGIPKNDKMQFPDKFDKLYRSHGCSKCNFIGYTGRLGIYEIFSMSTNIEKIILANVSTGDMLAAARAEGMISMGEDGILKMIQGVTSVEEVHRVTGIMGDVA
ncbi:MAG: type II/IV secretion system protein [Candidatus Pacebacteria bacterium]|nr:type II/IV secretion system protein [Candidatus Paceibacterota bacterium]